MRSHLTRLLALASILLVPTALHAQTTWTGAVSTSWDTAGNWSPAAVPTAATDVIIAAAANQPSTYFGNPSCNSLDIEAAATMTLGGGFDLSVVDALNVDGTLTVTAATSEVTVGGDVSIGGTFTARGGTVELTGTGSLGGGGSTTFFNLIVSGGVRTLTGTVIVLGDMVVEGASTLDLDTFTIQCSGNWTSSAAGVSITGTGTVAFTDDGLVTTVSNSLPNMSVSGGVRSVNPSAVAGDLSMTAGEIVLLDNVTLTVGGNATLSGGTLGFTSTFAGDEVLDVEGDVTLTAAAGATSASVRILCAGNWSSSSAFAPGAGWVELDGAGATTLSGATPTFANLRLAAGTKTLSSAAAVSGDLEIGSGTTFDTTDFIDVNGSVSFDDASASWLLGTSNHLVAGDWTAAGASATGTGSVTFDGPGTLSTGAGTIANVVVTSGTRTVLDSDVSGSLAMTGGTLDIQDDQTVTVGGDLLLFAGTLSFQSSSPLFEVLDVEGDATITAAAGSFSSDVRVRCAGDWSSSAAFAPSAGIFSLDGGTAKTISGTGTVLPNLTISSGTKTLTATASVTGNLVVSTGATLDTDASLDVDGNVTLGNNTANWDTGTSTHTVGGHWTSSGASATGLGTIHFDGTGDVSAGGGVIASVLISTGTRSFSSLFIIDSLSMTGGVLSIADNQTVTVGGNATLSAGTLEFVDSLAGFEVLDVEGSLVLTATAGSMSANSRISCGGDWTSSGAWVPTAGLVSLDGPLASTVSGAGLSFPDLVISIATRTLNDTTSVDNLALFSGGSLVTNAVLDVNADVVLGLGTSTWDMGGLTHTVDGDWTSSGGSATNGTIEFDGAGSLSTASGSIASVRIGNTRSAFNASITGDLELVSPGVLTIEADQTLSVGGNAILTADTLAWAAVSNGTPDVLDVEGDVTLTAAAGTMSTDSRLYCAGNWSSSSAFTPTAGLVMLDGAGATTLGGAGTTFRDLTIESGVRTVLAPVSVTGSLSISSGATLDADAVIDVDANVSLGDATATWDLGALTHTVAGDWTSANGSATGAGTIHFDGTGDVTAGTGAIANVLSSAGTRQFNDCSIPGNLDQTGGDLNVLGGQTLSVGGNATLGGGTIGWPAVTDAVLDVIDVEGNVVVTSAAGTTSADSRFLCAGNWQSNATFAPGDGVVVLDGLAPTTATGAGLTLAGLRATGSTKTILVTATVTGLEVSDDTALVTNGALDVNGSVLLGSATASWDLGAFTHTVSGDWTSTGGSATGAGIVEFDGAGSLSSGTGTIAQVLVSSGTRTASTSAVAGDLDMTGGALAIGNNEVLSVGGNCTLSAGTLSFAPVANSVFDELDIEGDMTISVPIGTESTDSLIRCAGNWTASSAFVPVLGTVELDGGAATIDGSEVAPSLFFGEMTISGGTKTIADDVAVAGKLEVTPSGTLVVGGIASAIGASEVLMQGSMNIGTATVSVSGDWASNGAVTSVFGTGMLELTGAGTLTTGTKTVPNVTVTAGARVANASVISGTLDQTGGSLTLADNVTVTVGGDATFTAGTLGFDDTSAGFELLDVNGSVVIDIAASTMNSNSHIDCAGDWTSSGTWTPAGGLVTLNGVVPTTISGLGTTLPDVLITGSTRTLTTPASMGNLGIFTGALVTSAVVDIDGDVALGTVAASWDMGGLTHTVAGGWSSFGASATNGTIVLDGSGTLKTAAGSIANLDVTAGARSVLTSSVTGNLSLTGGTLTIEDDQTLSVGGDASLTAGTLAFAPVAAGASDVLDVEGNVVCTATAGTTSTDSVIRCAGDWTSDSSFAPGAGTVELDGASPTLLSGNGPGFDPSFSKLRLRNGLRTVGNDLSVTASNLTIEAGASLETGDKTLTAPASAVSVEGTLSVQAGGTLALGAGSAVNVPGGGTLSVVGTSTETASILGFSGGGYVVNIDGTLEATHYLIEQPGVTGIIVNSAASIGSAPNDLRVGTFSKPSATPGSVLLDIRRSSPTEFRYVDFKDPGLVGTNNVRTLSGSVITFTNSDGNFSGALYEQDPFRLIEWEDDLTVLTFFSAIPGADEVNLSWESSAEVDVDSWILQRGTSPGGPFIDLIEIPATGPGPYMHTDASVTPFTLYYYNLAQKLTHGEVEVLEQRSAKPWSSAPPPNFLTVGPSGDYADIGSAIAALVGGIPVISVEGGTYPSFTIGAGVTYTVRILADGSGPVIIDTTTGPVTISGLPGTGAIEMSDLVIGDAGSPNKGLVIENCDGIVILDESVVHGGAGLPGVHVSNSSKVAIQRSDMDGTPGLLADLGTTMIASKGSLDAIELADASFVRTAELPAPSTVEAGSTLTVLAGVMSGIDAPEFPKLGEPFTLTLTGEPGGTWVLNVSLGFGWHDFPGALWELVGIASLPLNVLFVDGPMPGGTLPIPSSMPPDAVLYGFPIVLQTVVVHPGTGVRRWSNVISLVPIG